MTVAWIFVSVVLGVMWVVIGAGALWIMNDEGELNKTNFQIYSAFMALGLIFVVFHWIIVLLVLPVAFVYGMWQAFRLPRLLKEDE